MYSNPYNNIINTKVKEGIEKLDKRIFEERIKDNPDSHKIIRMEEQKLLQGMFDNEYGSYYGRYRNPW